MADIHFPQAYRDVRSLNRLAQYISDIISAKPLDTTALRKTAMQELHCTKSQFDTALKNLQITMNIVRLNDPQIDRDTWAPFRELYLEVWQRYVDRTA